MSTDNLPLGEAVAHLEAQGYTGQLAATDDARVICYTCHQTSQPGEVELTLLLRTEGASDPDDEAAIAGVTCPHCGTKGILVLHYGSLAPVEHDLVLAGLEDHRSR